MKRWTGLRLVAVLMALLVGGFGCTAAESIQGGAPANGATLNADEFAAAMEEPGTVVVDVRTPAEFASGHIEGAVNIDVSAADFTTRIDTLAREVPYAVYCRSGNRSGTALQLMEDAGFTQAYHLGGGVTAWTSSGRALVEG